MSEFEEWLATRPKVIQEMGRQYPPDKEYRIKSTEQTCVLHSYSENRTVTVDITSPTFENVFGAQRRVFGIEVDDLEPLSDASGANTEMKPGAPEPV